MENYIVQYSDTLETIAKKQLGNKSRWLEIAQMNGVQSPYELLIGQRLNLPPKMSPGTSLPTSASPPMRPLPIADKVLARGSLFVIFEQLPEVGSTQVIRKIARVPYDFSSHLDLQPTGLTAALSPAEHALGVKPSQYLSASNRPYGSPTNVDNYVPDNLRGRNLPDVNLREFVGRDRPVLVDLDKLPHGTQVVNEAELLADLSNRAELVPSEKVRIGRLMNSIRNVEGEVLIEGGLPTDAVKKVSDVHSAFILTAEQLRVKQQLGQITQDQLTRELDVLAKSYNRVKIVGRVGRVISVVGVVFTAVDVAAAAQRSYDRRSFRPLAAESVRQIGGWAGGLAGAKLGFVFGAALGIETGPGLFVTGAIGSIIFGAAGYFGANWVASRIDNDSMSELRKDVNRVESMKGQNITLTVQPNESQYDFRRRALMGIALEAQRESMRMVGSDIPLRFANQFMPPDAANGFRMNWVNSDGMDTNSDGIIDQNEWKTQYGRSFTYIMGESEINELLKMIFRLNR